MSAALDRCRPLAPRLDNIVPPDRAAMHGWVLLATPSIAAGSWDRRAAHGALVDHITAGAGMEVRGVSS